MTKLLTSNRIVGYKSNLLVQELGEVRVKFREVLESHTYHKSKGVGEAFYIASNQQELSQALEVCQKLQIPVIILGSGSRIVIDEEVGIKGLVIKNRADHIVPGGIKDVVLECDSGVSMRRLSEYLSDNKLKPLIFDSMPQETIGGCIWWDKRLQEAVNVLKVWKKGKVLQIQPSEIDLRKQVILSVYINARGIEI